MDSSSCGARAYMLGVQFGVRAAEEGYLTFFRAHAALRRTGAWHVKNGCCWLLLLPPTQCGRASAQLAGQGQAGLRALGGGRSEADKVRGQASAKECAVQRPCLSARLPRTGLPSARGRGRSVAITARPGSAETAAVRVGAISGPKFHTHERSHAWGMDKASRLI
jgi:hypothetical protein